MKKMIGLLALLPLLAFAKEANTTLKVSGWMCDGCPMKTEAALKKVNGVKAVKTDAKAETAQVTYDDAKTKRTDLEKAVAESGFQVAK